VKTLPAAVDKKKYDPSKLVKGKPLLYSGDGETSAAFLEDTAVRARLEDCRHAGRNEPGSGMLQVLEIVANIHKKVPNRPCAVMLCT